MVKFPSSLNPLLRCLRKFPFLFAITRVLIQFYSSHHRLAQVIVQPAQVRSKLCDIGLDVWCSNHRLTASLCSGDCLGYCLSDEPANRRFSIYFSL